MINSDGNGYYERTSASRWDALGLTGGATTAVKKCTGNSFRWFYLLANGQIANSMDGDSELYLWTPNIAGGDTVTDLIYYKSKPYIVTTHGLYQIYDDMDYVDGNYTFPLVQIVRNTSWTNVEATVTKSYIFILATDGTTTTKMLYNGSQLWTFNDEQLWAKGFQLDIDWSIIGSAFSDTVSVRKLLSSNGTREEIFIYDATNINCITSVSRAWTANALHVFDKNYNSATFEYSNTSVEEINISKETLAITYNGSQILNLPTTFPTGIDFYCKIPTLFSITQTFLSLDTVNVEGYTRYNTSSSTDTDISAYSGTPSKVEVSPTSLKINGTEYANSSWYIKNKTSLTATIIPIAEKSGITTGDIEPKSDDTTIGNITPYKSISAETFNGGAVSCTDFTLNGNSLLDTIYPTGSIYMSLVDTSPASFIGGTWSKLPTGYALWTADSGLSLTNDDTNKITAGLPNIKGSFYPRPHYTGSASFNGAIMDTDNILFTYKRHGFTTYGTQSGVSEYKSTASYPDVINFNASSYNSIYSDSISTVQPPAYKIYAWKRTS